MSKVRADNYSNRLGTGAPVFPDGANVTGVCTATSFKGDGSTLSNVVTSTDFIAGIAATFTGNVSIAGTLTYQDVTNVDAIGVITARSGVSIGDSIFHTDDTDTSIRFPAVDTFTVETAGNERLRLDSSGNMGLGVTPNTHNIGKALEIGTEGNVLWGEGAGNIHLLSNAYYNGGYKYATSAPAGRYNIYQNTHSWARATSGTADAAATFTESMKIDSSGRLLVNKTTSANNNIGGIGYANVVQIEGAAVGAGLDVRNDAQTARINITWKETEANLSDGDKLGHLSFGAGVTNAVERARIECNAQTTNANGRGGQLVFMTCADGGHDPVERLRISNTGTALFKGGLAEKYENAGTTLGSQTNNPLSDGNVILFGGNESGNLTINFTEVHAALSTGETVSFTVILTPNNSGKITAVQIDGQTPAGGLYWSGGSAPSAGASGRDIYTFQILKTATGVTNYTVFGAATNYATV